MHNHHRKKQSRSRLVLCFTYNKQVNSPWKSLIKGYWSPLLWEIYVKKNENGQYFEGERSNQMGTFVFIYFSDMILFSFTCEL